VSARKSARLSVVPCTLKAARAFVASHHRHHRPGSHGLFAVAVAREAADEVCGVAIVSRPSARMLCDGWTAEVTRCATDGTPNACSVLYGAAWRAARALGYRKLITYTLKSEGGGSLVASGWRSLGECGGGSWGRKGRPRVDKHPTQMKIRWEKGGQE
jgi:hypothetical protein